MKKMFKKEAITGWIILALGIVFVWMGIDPLMNDTEEFLKIMGLVLGGGIGSTLVIMWILERTLPNDKDSEKDQYYSWIEEEYGNIERTKDSEYSQDNWNSKVDRLNKITGRIVGKKDSEKETK